MVSVDVESSKFVRQLRARLRWADVAAVGKGPTFTSNRGVPCQAELQRHSVDPLVTRRPLLPKTHGGRVFRNHGSILAHDHEPLLSGNFQLLEDRSNVGQVSRPILQPRVLVIGAELVADHGHVVGDRPTLGRDDLVAQGLAVSGPIVLLRRGSIA